MQQFIKIHSRAFGSGTVTLIASKEEIRDIMETVRYL